VCTETQGKSSGALKIFHRGFLDLRKNADVIYLNVPAVDIVYMLSNINLILVFL
jgi:hypothetical protein